MTPSITSGTGTGAGGGTGTGGGTGAGDPFGSRAPQPLQNLAWALFTTPHFRHCKPSEDMAGNGFAMSLKSNPQLLQNFAFSEFAVAHFGQFMGHSTPLGINRQRELKGSS